DEGQRNVVGRDEHAMSPAFDLVTDGVHERLAGSDQRGNTNGCLAVTGGPSETLPALVGDRHLDASPPQAARHGQGASEVSRSQEGAHAGIPSGAWNSQ